MVVRTRVLLLLLVFYSTPDHQLPLSEMSKEAVQISYMTRAPVGANEVQKVEERLDLTCKKLCETEVNIRLFGKMVKRGVVALPLFWENQKINFAMRFSGYACSH